MSRTTVYSWIDAAQEKEKTRDMPINLRIFHDLKARCQRLENIIEILKSSPCCPSAPLSEKYEAITQMRTKYNVNILCETLDVAKGSYYNYINRNKNENTQYSQKIKELTPIVEKIYHSSNETYGAARIHAVLKDRGYNVGERTIAKIMQQNGWYSVR